MNIVEFLRDQDDSILGTGCNEEDILAYENEMSISFSEEYFLYLLNYGIGAYDGHELTGIGGACRVDVKNVTEELKKIYNVPDDFYVVEDTNIDGIIIWQSSKGDIYLTQPNYEYEKICDSLLEYIMEY